MKIHRVYFLLLSCLFFSCNSNSDKKAKTIAKHANFTNNNGRIKDSALKTKLNTDTSYLEYVFAGYDLINLQTLDSSINVNLKYADTNNFLKLNIYDGLKNAYFPCEVAIHLCNAQIYLKQLNLDFSLIIFDAARPLHVQQMMWDSLDMPPDIKYAYLSPPFSISLHNYGCAVDLSIIDLKTNKLLDMGSEFDYFGKLSQPAYEWQFLKSRELSEQAFENRKLLRKVMSRAGFFPITSEWWHFNFCSKEFAATNYKLIK